MKKSALLFVFLIIVLNFGNSGTANKKLSEGPQKKAKSPSTLNLSQQLIAFQLDTLFTKMNQKGTFNGSVLVAKAGKILFQKSLGYLDKDNNGVLSDSSMFQLASVSKVITATAVLMLHERELIDINQTFQNYFPDFPYQGITVKELLNHRSGLPNYIYALNYEIYQPNYQMSNVDMYNYLIAKNPKPYLKPNTRFN